MRADPNFVRSNPPLGRNIGRSNPVGDIYLVGSVSTGASPAWRRHSTAQRRRNCSQADGRGGGGSAIQLHGHRDRDRGRDRERERGGESDPDYMSN